MKKIYTLILFSFIGIIANAQCNAAFTYLVSGDTIQLTSTSTFSTTVNYQWAFHEDHCSTTGWYSSSPLPFQVNYAGDYKVCLTINDSGNFCNSTVCHTITVSSGPHVTCDASFGYWKDTSVLHPVYMGANNPNTACYAKKWMWDFGDGSYDTTINSSTSHQYFTNATYTVCLKEISMSGDTCTFCDTVNSTPCAILLNTSFTKALNNNTATFSSNCSGATNPNYYWDFGDGNYSSLSNPINTYQYNGTYTICLTYSGNFGCSEVFCDTIAITNALPYPFPCNAIFSYYGDSMGGNAINFYDQSTANIVSRVWSFPGGNPSTSTATNVHVVYPVGTYTAYLTVTNQAGISCLYNNLINVGTNCNSTTAGFYLIQDTMPHVWDIYDISNGVQPISYLWNWGDGSPNSTGTSPSHTYAQAGWYNICMNIIDANGCGASFCSHDTLFKMSANSSMVTVNVISSANGVHQITNSNNQIKVYPNPFTENITLNFVSEENNKITYEIFDMMGNQIVKENVNVKKGENEFKISAHAIAKGVYFINVIGNNGKKASTLKIVK